MAAAAFEALFHGDEERDFERDPGAVVIWFSDDPSLNEQTRYRVMQASDRINLALDQPRLQPFRTLNPAFALDLR